MYQVCKNCGKKDNNLINGIEWIGSEDDYNPYIKPIEPFCWTCFKRPGRHQTFSAYFVMQEYGDREFRKVFHRITKIPVSELMFNWCQ